MAKLSYLFLFGRTPKLAFRELRSIIPQCSLLSQDIAVAGESDDLQVETILDRLGGTIKVARLLSRPKSVTVQDVLPYVASYGHSIEFGVSFYGFSETPENFSFDIKKELEKRGIRARYVKPQHGTSLSAVAVDKSHLVELIILKTNDGFIIGKTVAVQRYEEWNKRDYGRPYADAKIGMLPPKVARMIVNIAGSVSENARKRLLDPFCGMGTILAEGYLMGWDVLGSDASEDIVRKAKENVSWVTKQYSSASGRIENIFACDATHISEHIASGSINAIVTEPYMGSTGIVNTKVIDQQKIRNMIKGLEKLYIGCLRDWQRVLISRGIVIIALPEYSISQKPYFVKKVVDMCENLGYTIVDGPIEYSRPQAVVKRQFYIFQKK